MNEQKTNNERTANNNEQTANKTCITSMTTEDLVIHNGCDGQAVEAVCEGLPQLDVVPSLAFKK